ncbi:MAG: hypothetical protein J5379_07560 [Clostridiales bacterium]|nr:hypothetical protein [Clostridiales bacterium]
MHRRISDRWMSVLLMLCFLTGMLTSCSKNGFLKKKIDVPEMARIVVNSIQDLNAAEDLFKQIPEEQRDGTTYSEFYEYISVLQKMIPRSGLVSSFAIVEGQEREELLESMISNDSQEYQDLIRGCIPIMVQTTGTRISGVPLYFYLQTKTDGTVYLNRGWIRSCVNLYAFAVHYFEAYSNKNLTDVISLLPYTEVPEPLPDSAEVLREKANEMIRFYSQNVTSEFREYEMISLDASNLVYLQPKVLDTHLQSKTRKVQFRSDEDDVISVVDPITNELKTADLYLYYNGRRTVRIGEHAAPSQLRALFGEPITISCGPVIEKASSGNEEDGLRNILIRYSGFTITVYGVFHDEEDWDGTYVRFRIWDSEKAGVGAYMSVDQSSWEILSRYPFADETGYVLKISMDGEDYEFRADLDKEHARSNGSYPIKTLILERIGDAS